MSDDYHDDDSRSGGLWDPDAHTPPPARERPTLRVIESNDDDNGSSPHGLVAGSGDGLVRLDQFRPVDLHDSGSRHQLHRRVAAFGATVLTITVIALIAIKISADDGAHAPPTISTRLSTDPEQAALVRKVAPRPTTTKHRPRTHRASPHTKRPSSQHAATPLATHVRSSPSPPAQQPSQSTTASKPKKKLRQYDAVSSDTTTPELTQPVASSEFGFEP
jgi:hypothetical protein